MTQSRIVIDLARNLEDDLFDEDLLARLAAVGDVSRTGGNGDSARMNADVLITGWNTPALPSKLGPNDRVRLLVHSAGTIRALVPKALIEDGVRVSQASAGMARSVAELALFFTLSLLRSLQGVDREMRLNRNWAAASAFGLGRTVASETIGVVGASRVGRIYIEMVHALGATVQVYDPFLSAREAAGLGVVLAPLDELLRDCRVVALHAPVTPETRNLLSAERLAHLRDGSILINTARSAILDSAALERELCSGRLSAALDVFDEEPLPGDSPLWGLPNVILTPHIGAVTQHSRSMQGRIVVEEIERFLQGAPLQNEVLAETYDRLA
jgi:Phosphoglycerate dehydrogenase and related dehydrogenases